MFNLKAVLFDLDDTLIDWSNFSLDWRKKELFHFSGVYQYVLDQGGNPNSDVETMQESFSQRGRDAWAHARMTLRAPHIGKLLQDTFKHFGVADEQLPIEDLQEAFRWGAVDGVNVFADVPEALRVLKENDIQIGIVTNAHQPITMRDKELDAYGLLNYFTSAPIRICAADVGYLKPHPFIFQHALTQLQAEPQEVVFVGDNVVADISGAQKVGMKAVLRINAHEPRLSSVVQPDASVKHFGQLLTQLDSWYPGWR
jgi:HAD superfamily hydrolase (TIGR01662 family)